MDLSLEDVEILCFIDLIKTQPELFSNEDKTSLLTLVNTLPNDKEEIANQIVNWYQDLPKIEDAMLKKLSADAGFESTMINRNMALTPAESKELIKNAVI